MNTKNKTRGGAELGFLAYLLILVFFIWVGVLKTQIGELKQQAIKRGYAEYVVKDPLNDSTEFRWKEGVEVK